MESGGSGLGERKRSEAARLRFLDSSSPYLYGTKSVCNRWIMMKGPDRLALGFPRGGPNWAVCVLMGRTRGWNFVGQIEFVVCFMSLNPVSSYKAFFFTVSYDLSLILIAVMFKGFNYFCCTYYYQHYVN